MYTNWKQSEVLDLLGFAGYESNNKSCPTYLH